MILMPMPHEFFYGFKRAVILVSIDPSLPKPSEPNHDDLSLTTRCMSIYIRYRMLAVSNDSRVFL
jgi:hypothetical protein